MTRTPETELLNTREEQKKHDCATTKPGEQTVVTNVTAANISKVTDTGVNASNFGLRKGATKKMAPIVGTHNFSHLIIEDREKEEDKKSVHEEQKKEEKHDKSEERKSLVDKAFKIVEPQKIVAETEIVERASKKTQPAPEEPIPATLKLMISEPKVFRHLSLNNLGKNKTGLE